MDRRWLVLSVGLLTGCSQATRVEVAYEPPIKTDTSFANLPRILAAIPKSGDVMLYRGLASEFWEPELRSQQLSQGNTVKLDGYPFHDRPTALAKADAERLTAIFSSRATYRRYGGKKRCSGYSPEFGVEWRAGAAIARALICLECAEVKMFGAKSELYCDLGAEAMKELEPLLSRHREDRPSA